ncbi:MAG: hypothetical protein QJR03_10295 [Sphaerobacter sp.]|nr:hypothetical protein [Sphaerobacter sp.]
MVELAIGHRFLRSVRVDRDWRDPAALGGYVITPQARQVTQRIAEALAHRTTERAWTITGPYGTGKSAFAVFLIRLLASPETGADQAWDMLQQHDPELAEHLQRALAGRRFLPIVITARRTTLARCLLDSLAVAASDLGLSNDLTELHTWFSVDASQEHRELPDDRQVVSLLESITRHARHQGFDGVVLVIDELGKMLEYAARHPELGDVFLLQELAEFASRSGDQPVLVLGVLHQAFEHYAQHLDSATRREWAKVQGRFSDVAFLEPPEQLMHLAADAVAALGDLGPDAASITVVAERSAAPALGLRPPGMDPATLTMLAKRAAPLHPVVLVVLPYLFRRLAQNERSLFTYLLGQEPFGLQERIRERRGGWVRVPDVFDYVLANLAGGMQRHPIHQRWLEVVNKLDEHPELTVREAEVIKTVGVLGVLAEGSHLRASPALISFALTDQPDDADVAAALRSLEARSLLVYRRFNGSYRVWEGSDIDITARVEEALRKTAGQVGLGAALERYLPPRPLVARRHSHETGALRFFEVRYVDEPLPTAHLQPKAADGLVVCCLAANSAQAEAFRTWAIEGEPAQRSDIVVALPEQIGSLREAAAELVALHWVRENTPSLRDDRVARRELDARTADVEAVISQLTERLLDPRPAPTGAGCTWYWRGEQRAVHSPRGTATLLSDVMDTLYARSPRIRNELINRRALSSAAAAARRNLVERMLTASEQPHLGIRGYPPERAMYESVLRATGLHREGPDGQWTFSPPSEDDEATALAPAWRAMEERVFAAIDMPLGVDALFAQLAAPPYGVMDGVLPVLLCAFLQVHRDAVSLYREGAYVPDPSVADFEILMRRPELFAIGGAQLTGARKAVIDRMARGLGVVPALFPVVRALLRMVRTLPEHAWRTRELPPEVIRVREALEKAKAPEGLLFHDLPLALGEMPFVGVDESPERLERFFERLNWALKELNHVTPRRIAAARDELLRACGLPTGPEGFAELRRQARALAPIVTLPMIQPFLQRLASEQDDEVALESVLALVANRPVRAWTDRDVERFHTQATLIGERFREIAVAHMVLSSEEEAQSEALVHQLRQVIGDDIPTHVLRASLLRLLNEITRGTLFLKQGKSDD